MSISPRRGPHCGPRVVAIGPAIAPRDHDPATARHDAIVGRSPTAEHPGSRPGRGRSASPRPAPAAAGLHDVDAIVPTGCTDLSARMPVLAISATAASEPIEAAKSRYDVASMTVIPPATFAGGMQYRGPPSR
jgi:hypothetical protein